jgi:predicted transcriptional regulator
MFRIQRGSETVSKTFRLPAELANRLEQLASENNLSLNNLVVQCLRYALDNLDEEKDLKSQSENRQDRT